MGVRCAATVMLVVVLGLGGLAGCNDVRDFAGTWRGDRVREWPSPAIGVADSALLTIDAIDKHGLRGSLHVSTFFSEGGPLVDSTFSSLEAAEGDVLASMTFATTEPAIANGEIEGLRLTADAAIVLRRGDVILGVDTQRVTSTKQLNDLLEAAGSSVTLAVRRDGLDSVLRISRLE